MELQDGCTTDVMGQCQTRGNLTDIQHPSGLSVKLKYCMWYLQYIYTTFNAYVYVSFNCYVS